MSNLYMMIGPAGCGKSTLANQLSKSLCAEIVSSDKIRHEIYGDPAIQKDHEAVFNIAHKRIVDTLSTGDKHVIFDATNLQRVHRKKVIELVNSIPNVMVIGIVYDGDLNMCLERNEERDRRVPSKAIERMFYTLHGRKNAPIIAEGFDELWSFEFASRLAEDVE